MPDVLGVYDNTTVDEYLQFFAGAYRVPRASWAGADRRPARARRPRRQARRAGQLPVPGHEAAAVAGPGARARPRGAHPRRAGQRTRPPGPHRPADAAARRSARWARRSLISSHILPELQEVCTDVAIMEAGRLLAAGAPRRDPRPARRRPARPGPARRRRGADATPSPTRPSRPDSCAICSPRGSPSSSSARTAATSRSCSSPSPRGWCSERDPSLPAEPTRGRRPMNPVLARELRIRLRAGRSWVLLTVYLAAARRHLLPRVTRARRRRIDGDPFAGAVAHPVRRGRAVDLRVARPLHAPARAVPGAGLHVGRDRRRAGAPDAGAAAGHAAAAVADPRRASSARRSPSSPCWWWPRPRSSASPT